VEAAKLAVAKRLVLPEGPLASADLS
jgi:hypothetical protein